ncbi:MAG: SGNH/GDSL hydrolase family protein [Sphingomonas sp.]
MDGAAALGAARNLSAVLGRRVGLSDSSIVLMGDSVTSNSNSAKRTGSTSDTWTTKSPYSMLIARSGGKLRPVQIAGWPYLGVNSQGLGAVFVARGGSGYNPATTTASVQTGVGGTGGAVALTIANGVIVAATVTAPGQNYAQSPIITITDTSGSGSGAIMLAQVIGTGQYAVGGIGTQEMEAYVPLILNNGSPVAHNVLFAGGTNDSSRGMSIADSKFSIVKICSQLVAGGVRVFYVPPLHRNSANGVAPQKAADHLRRWATAYLPGLVPGVIVIDPTPWFTDANVTGSGIDGISTTSPTAYATDGLHPTSLSSDVLANKSLWPAMAPYFSSPSSSIISANSGYDATSNPDGNLLSGAQTLISTGTTATPNVSTEAPWTGTRMAGIFLSRVTGGTGSGTAVASVPTRTDGRGGTYQQLAMSMTGCAQGETFRVTWTTAGTGSTLSVAGAPLNVGDTIKAAIDEVVMSNCVGLRGAKLKILTSNSSNGFPITPNGANIHSVVLGTAAWGDYEDDNYPQWQGDTLWFPTREFVIPASSAYVTMVLEFVVNAGTASFTAKLFGASIRRIAP